MAKRSKGGLKAEITKYGRAVSPKGIAAWAYLDDPAENMDGKLKQKITVFFKKDDPEFQAFLKQLVETEKEHASATGKVAGMPSCLKIATAKDLEKVPGIAVGDPFVEFSTNPREAKDGTVKPVPVVGANAQPTSEQVWMGDIVRVQCNIAGWEQPTKRGIKCYLSGVQLLKSNKKGGSGIDMFAADAAFAQAEEAENAEFTPDTEGLQDESNAALDDLLKPDA